MNYKDTIAEIRLLLDDIELKSKIKLFRLKWSIEANFHDDATNQLQEKNNTLRLFKIRFVCSKCVFRSSERTVVFDQIYIL